MGPWHGFRVQVVTGASCVLLLLAPAVTSPGNGDDREPASPSERAQRALAAEPPSAAHLGNWGVRPGWQGMGVSAPVPQGARARSPEAPSAPAGRKLTALATTLLVNSANDDIPEAACTDEGRPCTLRAALTLANAAPDLDVIRFASPLVIRPQRPLPALTTPVAVDGTTAPGGAPSVQLTGADLPRGHKELHGLDVRGGGSTIRALVIADFPGSGIMISGPGGNRVEGCRIGTDADGSRPRPNGTAGGGEDRPTAGVTLLGSARNTIGGSTPGSGNVISGNEGAGIIAAGSRADHNVVQGNRIGTDASGSVPLANTSSGILLSHPVSGPERAAAASENTVGGADPRAGNIVSGNEGGGIVVVRGTGNRILGNLVGLDASGGRPVPNEGDGIAIEDADRTTVSGNTSSANGGTGIYVQDISHDHADTTRNRITGNLVGTDTEGVRDFGNGHSGLLVLDATDTVIGGTAARYRNTVAHNGGYGIYVTSWHFRTRATEIIGNNVGLDSEGGPGGNRRGGLIVEDTEGTKVTANVLSGNTGPGLAVVGSGALDTLVTGNRVGTDASGRRQRANRAAGIVVRKARNTTIGSPRDEDVNIVSGNGAQGIAVEAADRTTIVHNAIGTRRFGGAGGSEPDGPGNGASGISVFNSTATTIGARPLADAPTPCRDVCNLISGNARNGVRISGDETVAATVRGNVIDRNGGLGIDLVPAEDAAGPPKVTPNDSRDEDMGANGLVNFPLAVLAHRTPDDLLLTAASGPTEVTGVLDPAPPDPTRVDVDIYGMPSADIAESGPRRAGPASHGQGPVPLGTAHVDAQGDFLLVVPPAQAARFATYTATVTDATGATSEFSATRTAPRVE
jgi:parallel beta-helix repeat protein